MRRTILLCTTGRRGGARRRRRGATLIEVVLAVMLMAISILIFGAIQPTSAKVSRMNGNYSQAISLAQHKVDQLRAVGYGRLNYSELLAASIIDPQPTAGPFRFDGVDQIATFLPNPVATLSFASAGFNVMQATITIAWAGAPDKAMQGTYDVKVLIPNE